jgi:hypothetical protein
MIIYMPPGSFVPHLRRGFIGRLDPFGHKAGPIGYG